MNLDQKKAIALRQDINSLMERMGYQPVNHTPHDTWYLSPFRPCEEKPSFHVSKGTYVPTIWKDFGKGNEPSGGNIIHLVRELNGLGYTEAIDYILDYTTGNHSESIISFPKQENELPLFEQTDRHILKEAKHLDSPSLFNYLVKERKLTKAVVENYLRQVRFADTQTGKMYFAPGIQNLKGGYEINNQVNGFKFKSAIPSSSKSMSFMIGMQESNCVIVFEGFIDALSFLVHKKLPQFSTSTLILNSASFGKEAISYIQAKGFQEVYGYFDHDGRGRELTVSFSNKLGSAFNDQSHIYTGFKDYNAFIQENPASQNGLDLDFPGSG